MAKVQFFTQKMIDSWAAQGKVEFDGVTLKVIGAGKQYRLRPATMFLNVLEGKDTHRLVGKVLTEDHIKTLSADVYLDSALIGEVAYKVDPGFVVDARTVPVAAPDAAAPDAAPADTNEISLADLVLQSLGKP